MSFASTNRSSLPDGDILCPLSRAKYSGTSAPVETAELGARFAQCNRCSYQSTEFHSCRNRHCPTCQSTARERWLAQTAKELLPVPYSHVVFTLLPWSCRTLSWSTTFYSAAFGNTPYHRPRQAQARCGPRIPGCAPYLESKNVASPTFTLSGSRRRPLA